MYKYKLVQRSNPQDKGAPKKWYASPLSETAQDVKAMTRAATENTTVAPKEMEAALKPPIRWTPRMNAPLWRIWRSSTGDGR